MIQSPKAVILSLLVVFSAGAVAGWAFGRQTGLRQMERRPRSPDDLRQRMMASWQRDLELTPEQRDKMEPIVQETWVKIGEAQKACGRQIRDLIKVQHGQFKGFLSEGQWGKFQELEARRARRRSGSSNAPAGFPGHRPPGPPADRGPSPDRDPPPEREQR